jgi:hypothetical protein
MAFSFGSSAGGASSGGGFSFGASAPAAGGGFSFGAGGAAAGNSAKGSGFSFGGAGNAATIGTTGGSTGGFSFGGQNTGVNAFGAAKAGNVGIGGSGTGGTALVGALGGAGLTTNGVVGGAAGKLGGAGLLGMGMQLGDESSDGSKEELQRLLAEFGQDPRNQEATRFAHIFYNIEPVDKLVPPQRARERSLKPAFVRKADWDAARATAARKTEETALSNARDEMFFPHCVHGFIGFKNGVRPAHGLLARQKAQDAHATKLTEFVRRLQSGARALQMEKQRIEQSVEQLRDNQMKLSHHLLRIMKKIAVVQGDRWPLTRDETAFRNDVEACSRALNAPTEFKAKLSELSHLQRMQEQRPVETVGDIRHADSLALYDVLDRQRQGLAHLTDTLRKDERNMSIIGARLGRLTR